MKITKNQLRRIIREEIEDENMAGRDIKLGLGGPASGTYQHAQTSIDAVKELENAVIAMLKAYGKEETIAELYDLAMDIKAGKIS